MTTACLNQEELLCFLRSEEDIPKIATHIAACEECQNALATYSRLDILEPFLPAASSDVAGSAAADDTKNSKL
ncbi:MAG: hypothetical protein VB858_17065, partial [Planctomycetaceae bacterium]